MNYIDLSSLAFQYRHISKSLNRLIEGYTAGERNFIGINLSGLRILNNLNLSDVNFSKGNLSQVDMSNSNLSNANLEGADLSSTYLNNCNLTRANLKRANLRSATLMGANLTDAILTDANLEGANFSGCIMCDGIRDPAMERIKSAVEPHKQAAWIPIIKEGDSDIRCSKFAGKPWLNADEEWPVCPNCHKPMRFFLQLNLQELPQELSNKFGQGMLQLFYCCNDGVIEHDQPIPNVTSTKPWQVGDTRVERYIEYNSCDENCCGWEAFSPIQLVRIVQIDGVPLEYEIPSTPNGTSVHYEGEFPAKTIIGWEKIDTYPDDSNLQILGIELSSNDISFMYERGMYSELDKLAGWPNWVQNEEYPDCPK